MGILPYHDGGLEADTDSFLAWASEGKISGEQALWMAVLMRAVHDAFVSSDVQITSSENDKGGDFDPDIIRAEAKRWLTAGFGDYVEDREFVCEAAGVDVDDVVAASRKRLAEVKAEPAPAPEPELTPKEKARKARRRASQRKYQMRKKEAKRHGMSLEQYDEMMAKRRAYNRAAQLHRERTREKWLALAEAAE